MNNKPIVLPEAITPGSIVNVHRINPHSGKAFATRAMIQENRINDGLATLNGENVEYICSVVANDPTDGFEFPARYDQIEVLRIKG